MEFQPEPPQSKKEEIEEQKASQAVSKAFEDLSAHRSEPKSREQRKGVWDSRKAEQSTKFDPENVTQIDMFEDGNK